MNNNKVTFGIACLALAGVFLLTCIHFFTSEKIAYIDNGLLLNKYQGIADAHKEFENKTKSWGANVDTLGAEMERTLKKYEKERSSLSEKERKLQEELLQNKQHQYIQYRDAMQKKAKEEENGISLKALAKLDEFIKEYGEKHHYKIILGATNTGNVIYAEKTLNITDAIIEEANRRYNNK